MTSNITKVGFYARVEEGNTGERRELGKRECSASFYNTMKLDRLRPTNLALTCIHLYSQHQLYNVAEQQFLMCKASQEATIPL